LANLRGLVVPVVSAQLLLREGDGKRSAKQRYQDANIEYAAVIEHDEMEIAVACQKIFGVKSVELPSGMKATKPHDTLFISLTIEGKRLKLLQADPFARQASETKSNNTTVNTRLLTDISKTISVIAE
jgi:hypothetical protein